MWATSVRYNTIIAPQNLRQQIHSYHWMCMSNKASLLYIFVLSLSLIYFMFISVVTVYFKLIMAYYNKLI
jgi:hypothetical protein